MQILKKKELSRKSELKEYWGRYCGQNLQSWLGFSAGGGGDFGMKGRVDGKLRVRSECEDAAEGSGRHRAGSSWGIQQRQVCLRHKMHPPWVFCPKVAKAPPSRKSLSLVFSTSLPVSPSPSSSLQGLALWQSPYSTVSIQFK